MIQNLPTPVFPDFRSDLSQQISGINRQINEIRQQISSDNYNKPSMTITNNTQQFKGR